MSSHRIMLWLGVVAMALAMVGCSGESDSPVAASILSFQSSPSEIESGRSATLAWETQNATRVEIVEVGGGQVAIGDAPASRGSVQVSPTATTDYELRAYGKGRGVASLVTTITVFEGVESPTIVSFVADPAVATLGEDVVLSWMTTAADAVRITDASGTPVALVKGEEAAKGQVTLKPRSSTNFHMVATGPGGQSEADVSVAVHGMPTVTLKAPSQAIEPGGTAVLKWSATEAVQVTISDESGALVYDGAELTGEVEVEPQFTTVYTAVAKGAKGEGNARATVLVRPVVELFEARSSGPIYPGEEVELHWRVRGAREVTVNRLGLDPWVAPAESVSEGSVRLPAGPDGSFRLRARSGSVTSEALVAVTMQPVPRIVDLQISPDVVTADESLSATVTLSWFIDGASRIEIEGDDGQQVNVAAVSPRKGSVSVDVHGTTTFRLSAFNDEGVSVADRVVTAHRVPAIDAFVALPLVAAVGEEIHLSWETSAATAVILEKVGEGVLSDNQPAAAGTFGDVVLADSSYVLKAYNVLGYETVSEPVSISIGDPVIEHFAADRAFVRPGLPVTLSWRNIGGQDLVITDQTGATVMGQDGNPCATTDLVRIMEGSCVIPGPGVGEHTYTLHLRNGLNPPTEVTASFDVESVSGPVITSFVIEGSPNTVGVPLSFAWEMTEDIAGHGALVELSSDGEVFYSTSTPALSGTLDYAFPRSGIQRIVLRAHSENGEYTATRTVDIRDIPVIDSFEISPDEIDSTVDPLVVNFSWAWRHARTARIYQLAADGTQIDPPVMNLDGEGANATGGSTYDIIPGVHRFALVLDNEAGATAKATVQVEVDMAEATLSANKTDLMPDDDTVTLTWSTKHATDINITPLPMVAPHLPVARETTARFIDIQTLPGVTEHTLTGTDDSGVAHIELPAGFVFPYDGAPRTALRAWVDGVISFDLTNTGGGSNTQLPYTGTTTSQKIAHMALFWRDLHVARPNLPRAKILSALSSDEKGPFFAVQWSGIHPWATAALPSNLNFQAILRPNGVFEYRYGTMTSADDSYLGRSSTIGYQNTKNTAGFTLSHNTSVPGGLANRSWTFEPSTMAPSGSMQVKMAQSAVFTLWARNPYSLATDTAEVVFWQKPVITSTSPAQIKVGENFTINWKSTHSSKVQIIAVADGSVLCESLSSDGLAATLEGECTTVGVEGLQKFLIRSIGVLEGNKTEKEISVQVYRPFSLDRFAATPLSIMPGESATLSWETVGAATYELKANGVDVPMPQTASGSLVVTPALTTTYVLTIKDAPAGELAVRTLTSTTKVVVRSNTLDQASASQTQFAGGSGPHTVTLSWQSTNADGVQIEGVTKVEEVTGPSRFVDIRTSPTAQELARTFGSLDEGGFPYTLPADFEFSYDMQKVTDITASTNGWLSMSSVTSGWLAGNSQMPTGSTTNNKVHMAAFWDDLNDAKVWVDRGTDPEMGEFIVFQWDAIIYGSSSGRLNFQIVLFEGGNFEYRYGEMAASTAVRALGSSATIGFQNRTATLGHTVHHDSTSEEGFVGKTFRFRPTLPASGSTEVEVSDSRDFVICSFDAGHRDCKTVSVVFVHPGYILVTEFMADPGSGPQWVELRNTTAIALNLQGFTLENGAGLGYTIAQPLMVPAGGFAVLAASADANLAPDHVYGGIPFTAAGDTITLKLDSAVIDSVTWNSTWDIQTGKSRSLDGSYHLPFGGNSVETRWCQSAEPMAGGGMGSPGYLGDGCRLLRYTTDWSSNRPFIDISLSGSPIDKLNVDTAYDAADAGRPIGFAFPFFEGTYTEWYGSSNGLISFSALTEAYTTNASELPLATGASNFVAGFWDDLTPQTGSSVRTELVTVDTQLVRIVQWTGTKAYNQVGAITFQIQLWQNGDIVLAYKDISFSDTATKNRYLGNSATIGIENVDGTTGIPFLINQPWLYSGRVLAFERK